jgi:hypothetical protein
MLTEHVYVAKERRVSAESSRKVRVVMKVAFDDLGNG